MSRKSLLVDVRALGKSGLGRYTEDVVLGILPNIAQIFAITLLIDRNLPQQKLLEKNLLQYETVSTRPFKLICRKYDFCWFPTLRQPFWGPKNRILTVHDLAQFKLEGKSPKLLLRALAVYFIISMQLKKSLCIIFNSDFTYKEYKHYFKRKISQINYSKVINLTTRKVSQPIRQKQIKNNSLLYVGNLKYTKNLRTLVKAVSNIHDANLTVVSNGVGKFIDHKMDYLDEIKPEKIQFLSNITDCELREIYVKSDLLILPSLYEGWGYTPYEGLDYGCNVLISNIPPFNNIIEYDRVFFDPLNIESLSKLIKSYFVMTPEQKDKLYFETLDKCTVRTLDLVQFETMNAIFRALEVTDA